MRGSYSSELSSSPASGNKGTEAQQNDSRSLRRRQLPSKFHLRSEMVNWGSGTLTQHAPEGVHIYKFVLPVHNMMRGPAGSHIAARIGSLCNKMAASSRCCTSHTQRTAGMLSLRVKMYRLSLLHDIKPGNFPLLGQ